MVSRQISLLVHIETTAPGFGQFCFRQNLTNFLAASGRFWVYAFKFGPVLVGPFTTLHYKHLKEIYVICIQITSLRLPRVVLFFIVFSSDVYSMFASTLPISAFLVVHVFAKFSLKES